jgi:hypothetical protein
MYRNSEWKLKSKSKSKIKIDSAKFKMHTRYQRYHDSNYVMHTFYSVYSCKSAWYFRDYSWNTNELQMHTEKLLGDLNGIYVILLPVSFP